MKRKSILIADDDVDIVDTLRKTFEENHYTVYKAFEGKRAYEIYARFSPAVVVLDIDMPGIYGLDLAKKIRSTDRHTPIIILTGFLIGEEDSLECYNAGVNLFVRKSVSCKEFFACADSLVRTYYGPHLDAHKSGDIVIDALAQTVTVNSVEHKLTEREMKTFHLLFKNKNKVVTLSELQINIWKRDDEYSNTQMLRNTITELKKKVASIPHVSIESVYAKGYMLRIPDDHRYE